jgi:capsular polysaccharide transport system permease protein
MPEASMTDPTLPADNGPEDDRLAKWREERARVAEEQRAERLAAAETDKRERVERARDAREREAEAEAEARKEEVRRLLPTPESLDEARQRLAVLARSRKRRLFAQLAFLVVLPALLLTAYMALVATPLYEARSVVVVSKPGTDQDDGLGGILPGLTGGARLNEAFQAHAFIRSQALMQELEAQTGVVTRFGSTAIDPLRRLQDLPLLGLSKADLFDTFVTASIDVQTGLITLYVRAPAPQEAAELSHRVIDITASHINTLADQLFAERVAQALTAVAEAREQLRAAQSALTRLQIENGEIDPRARVQSVFATIEKLTLDLQTLRAEIEESEVAGTGDTVQTDRLRERERLLAARIEDERGRLVSEKAGESLNGLLMSYELAVLEVGIAEQTLTTALQAAEQARKDAALGRNFFQVVVPPMPTDHPTSPNLPRTGLLSLLVLLGLFSIGKLMLFRP